MRLDLVLKYLCLVKSRSIAKTLCEQNRVRVNDSPARPSHTVQPGDRIELGLARHDLVVEIVTVPERQLSKSSAVTYYRRVEKREKQGRDDLLEDL